MFSLLCVFLFGCYLFLLLFFSSFFVFLFAPLSFLPRLPAKLLPLPSAPSLASHLCYVAQGSMSRSGSISPVARAMALCAMLRCGLSPSTGHGVLRGCSFSSVPYPFFVIFCWPFSLLFLVLLFSPKTRPFFAIALGSPPSFFLSCPSLLFFFAPLFLHSPCLSSFMFFPFPLHFISFSFSSCLSSPFPFFRFLCFPVCSLLFVLFSLQFFLSSPLFLVLSASLLLYPCYSLLWLSDMGTPCKGGRLHPSAGFEGGGGWGPTDVSSNAPTR